ncbi:MAG: hypothetical protein AAF512_10330, partial [Pseudomonadota bacterium]
NRIATIAKLCTSKTSCGVELRRGLSTRLSFLPLAASYDDHTCTCTCMMSYRYQTLHTSNPTIHSEYNAKELDSLLNHVKNWPPITSAEKAAALKAEKIVHARTFTRQHWLFNEMVATYRKNSDPVYPYQVSTTSSKTGFHVPDSGWRAELNYIFNDDKSLKMISLTGGFDEFHIGRLKPWLTQIKRNLGIREEPMKKIFIQLKIRQDSIQGKLTLRGHKLEPDLQKEFSFDAEHGLFNEK